MTTNELMISDWVHSTRYKVDAKIIDVNHDSVWLDLNGQWLRHLEEDVYPIALTDAILKANGFSREGGASYWHEGGRDACILHWSEDEEQLVIGSPSDECMIKMNVRYVHELQHAFRLAGIDKEIKLED